ncbi:TRI14-like protein [Metarhizium album ARSEF 1941]|uniref:TRI14-like protein n=1 Tax=Metarhizium album (strain ARSEF 1941) TaxID=1081103 RepID=A0A0B2WJJ0_METAS|nr:TRI14-like protein [Metarhizium album ARSEF 1941]KHN96196.1 TRI14-like protein [Metarhizium album ARSEF 1941]
MLLTRALLLLSAGLGAVVAAATEDLVLPGSSYPESVAVDGDELFFRYDLALQHRGHQVCSALAGTRLYASDVAKYEFKDGKLAFIGTIPFRGLTNDSQYHASGVLKSNNFLFVSVNQGAPFESGGEHLGGSSFVVKYDLGSKTEVWRASVSAPTKGKMGGPQDFAVGKCGNLFVVGTYPGHIIKITPDGKPSLWWDSGSPKTTDTGLTSIVTVGQKLLAVDQRNGGQLVLFDSGAAEGKPVPVPLVAESGEKQTFGPDLDGATLLEGYNSRVLLVASNKGIIVVLAKDQTWSSAQVVGLVENRYRREGGHTSEAFELKGKVYAVTLWFEPAPRNRREFPLQDMTDALAEILEKHAEVSSARE